MKRLTTILSAVLIAGIAISCINRETEAEAEKRELEKERIELAEEEAELRREYEELRREYQREKEAYQQEIKKEAEMRSALHRTGGDSTGRPLTDREISTLSDKVKSAGLWP